MLLSYASIILIMSLFSVAICLRKKKFLLMLIYETGSGLYFSLMVFLQVFGTEGMNWYWFVPVPILICCDYWFFYHGASEELISEFGEINRKDEEIGKIAALLFIAPAYLIGMNLLYESLKYTLSQ